MTGYKKHVFLCLYERSSESGKKSCGKSGAGVLKRRLKKQIAALGLNKEIRINASGCLGQCEHGPVIVVYPQGDWYGTVQPVDLDNILNQSILDDFIIERLKIKQDNNEKTPSC